MLKLNLESLVKRMIKAIFFMIIGAAAAYLYLNPGDVDGMVDIGKKGIHKGAVVIQEATK